MFAATMALNGMTMYGRASGEWGVHSIGHILSLIYDVPHGASLTIVYPAWMRLLRDRIPHRIAQLGENLFNVRDPEETISRFEDFFRRIECPVRLKEATGDQANPEEIFRVMVSNKAATYVHKLDHDDYRKIIELMM